MTKTRPMHHGDNRIHEFYESRNHSLIVFRSHWESHWSACSDGNYVGSAPTAQEAAGMIGGVLDDSLEWKIQGCVWRLIPAQADL